MSAVWDSYRRRPGTLVGTTVLHIVPALREEPEVRAALEAARTLQQAGARAIIAGASGPLLDAVEPAGAEWLPLADAVVNPVKLRRNVQALEQFVAAERVDILHAYGATAAWSARSVAARLPVWMVTSLPDAPPMRRSPVQQFFDIALAAGDRVIASSAHAARIWIDRHHIGGDQIAVVPHAVDVAQFAPSTVPHERIAAIRHAWKVNYADRVMLVPGQIAPGNGQLILVDVATTLLKDGVRNFVFVLAGPKSKSPGYVDELARRARARGVEALFRIVGVPRDLPAVLASVHSVVVPAREPPILGRIVAQAQAMARPVIASDIGVLPENLLAPPRIAFDLRTGWLVKPDNVASLGRAVHLALTLDRMEYQAMAARARQFAEFMFAPQNIAAAIRGVYLSMLARDH